MQLHTLAHPHKPHTLSHNLIALPHPPMSSHALHTLARSDCPGTPSQVLTCSCTLLPCLLMPLYTLSHFCTSCISLHTLACSHTPLPTFACSHVLAHSHTPLWARMCPHTPLHVLTCFTDSHTSLHALIWTSMPSHTLTCPHMLSHILEYIRVFSHSHTS